MLSKPLGLSPVDVNTLYVTLGAGHPLSYGETGFAVSANMGHSVREPAFRPRFLSLCARGIVTFESWASLQQDLRFRKVVDVPKLVEVIRDVQIFLGGDYAYYRYFDPYVDYEKHPERMDRFLKAPVKVGGGKRSIAKQKLFEAQFKSHKKDPKNFRWF